MAAEKAKNISDLLNLVTEDVMFLPPGMPPIKGRDAVRNLYQNYFARFQVKRSAKMEEIEICGNLAYCWGEENLSLTPIVGGAQVQLKGKGMSIVRKIAQKEWKFARGINNLVPQPAAVPAK